MADDGMLVNFDLGSIPIATKATFKGGSWRDRVSAKRALKGGRERAAARKAAAATGGNAESVQEVTRTSKSGLEEERPVKRARYDGASHGTNGSTRARPKSTEKRVPKSAFDDDSRSSDKPKQVISSLFTYNPASESKATPQKDGADDNDPIQPSNAPLDSELDTFTSLGLSVHLADHLLRKMNIKAPTAIQRSSITQLMKENSDAFLQAETGSGKTLAYLLPVVQRIMALGQNNAQTGVQRDSGLFAIILAPTRELSKQISVVLESLLRCAHWIVSGTVIGGEKKKSEKARLRKGLNILIATPGRLADHLEHTEALDVGNVRWVVLDEGDRLMELGFEKDIEKILSKLDFSRKASMKNPNKQVPGLPEARTTILCSATMKTGVAKLGELSLKNAAHIRSDPRDVANDSSTAIPREETFSAPAQLKQSYTVVPAKLRLVTLTALLRRTFARRGSVMKAIVFFSCADSVDFHFELFSRLISPRPSTTDKDKQPADPSKTINPSPTLSSTDNPLTIHRMHGSLPQAQRTTTLTSFRTTKDPALMLCTDVAARGLDLPNVDLVIEYDPPFDSADHLHRIGRTARAGQDGRAVIFLLPGSEEGYVEILQRGRADPDNNARGVTLTDAAETLKRGFPDPASAATTAKKSKNVGEDHEDRATNWQLDAERWTQEDPRALDMARRAYISHVRAYATHVAAERRFFDMTKLHLGHLAKAFALRDRPGHMRVPGLKTAPGSKKRGFSTNNRGQGAAEPTEDADAPQTDMDEAKRKMRKMARMMGAGSSEFNLG